MFWLFYYKDSVQSAFWMSLAQSYVNNDFAFLPTFSEVKLHRARLHRFNLFNNHSIYICYKNSHSTTHAAAPQLQAGHSTNLEIFNVSVMVWGCFWGGGKSELYVLNAKSYIEILDDQLPSCWSPGLIFILRERFAIGS
jgi:hypothetical protein